MTHNDEVETITVYRGPFKDQPHAQHHHDRRHAADDAGNETLSNAIDDTDTDTIDIDDLIKALAELSKESVWRVKGFVKLNEGVRILNWAFGRYDLTKFEGGETGLAVCIRFTIMGERGEVKRASRKFVAALHADII